MRITVVCQVKTCKQEFHDIGQYYLHVATHEADKTQQSRDMEAK